VQERLLRGTSSSRSAQCWAEPGTLADRGDRYP